MRFTKHIYYCAKLFVIKYQQHGFGRKKVLDQTVRQAQKNVCVFLKLFTTFLPSLGLFASVIFVIYLSIFMLRMLKSM